MDLTSFAKKVGITQFSILYELLNELEKIINSGDFINEEKEVNPDAETVIGEMTLIEKGFLTLITTKVKKVAEIAKSYTPIIDAIKDVKPKKVSLQMAIHNADKKKLESQIDILMRLLRDNIETRLGEEISIEQWDIRQGFKIVIINDESKWEVPAE